jgi:hypothetical protein
MMVISIMVMVVAQLVVFRVDGHAPAEVKHQEVNAIV